MKQITLALALLLAVAALWLTGDRLSAEALAMLIGILLGISTSIPIALLLIIAERDLRRANHAPPRRRDRAARRIRQRRRLAAQAARYRAARLRLL